MKLLSLPQKMGSDIVVFSHLRWDFVWQRPQHLLSRLSKQHRIFFVEEPVLKNAGPELHQVDTSIWVLQPKAPSIESPEFNDSVRKSLRRFGVTSPIVWMYSAAFVNQLDNINSHLIVYDVMDQLSSFKGASKELKNQEILLLNLAHLVFTGGKSLYLSKSRKHPYVYCFPSSIEQKHFQKPFYSKKTTPMDMRHIPHPIVGFYGVLDERLDTQLISDIAGVRPDIHFVLIGPISKIDADDLPNLPNIHYLGMKAYKELPLYLQHFDVAFMPFAMNEATKFISPTKTLEFMAAHKPIVSTPITDVVSDYSHVVKIVSSAEEMAAAIDDLLHESSKQKKLRLTQESRILARTSWDMTARAMEKLITLAESDPDLEQLPDTDEVLDLGWLKSR
jgi:glycosyltransferase involved in cell wall biosynthesis